MRRAGAVALPPWVLAEPIGKNAAKLSAAIAADAKKAKKKAERAGEDKEAAARAVLLKPVKLKLPTADEIKAAWRRTVPAPPLSVPPAAPPSAQPPSPPPPAIPPTPAHECSEVCKDMCPRAHELYTRWRDIFGGVVGYLRRLHGGVAPSCLHQPILDDLDKLEMAELRFKQLLRRLQAAYMYPYPGEFFLFFTGFSQRDGRVDNHHRGLWYAQAISPSRSKNIRVQA